jgi:carbon-monoxide dehydrogenase medium subunit
MTMVPSFDYELAPSLEHALAALAGGATPIHGGTELLPAMGLGLLRPSRLVSLRQLDELRVCQRVEDGLVVGAGLTHDFLATSLLVAEGAPLLAEVAADVGNIRVRCTGTLGGNLAFAEPRSDIGTALLALDARLTLVSASGTREMAISEFLVGGYETDLREGELIAAVTVPFKQATVGVYRKIVFSERPVVGVAITLVAQRGWRLVVGAIGMSPLVVDADSVHDFDAAGIAAGADATEDLAGGVQYKRHLTAVTIERCRRAALEQWEQTA